MSNTNNTFLPAETPNEIYPELMSLNGLSGSASTAISSARSLMYGGHLNQSVPVVNTTSKRIQNDTVNSISEFDMNIKFPEDAIVIDVIYKYPKVYGDTRINKSNIHIGVIIYENANNELCCLEINDYVSKHPYFGWDYRPTENFKKLSPYVSFNKGDVLFETPGRLPTGEYGYGREVKIAAITIPGISEDSIVASDEVLKEYHFPLFHKKSIGFGSDLYPLNIYGDNNTIKIMPDIGDEVRIDSVVMALREHDPYLCVIEETNKGIQTVCPITDKLIKINYRTGVVCDIHVFRNKTSNSIMPPELEEQLTFYHDSISHYYEKIMAIYRKYQKQRSTGLKVTNEFAQLVLDARKYLENVTLLNKKEVLEPWHVIITIRSDIVPNIGFKFTGEHGDKGVVCKIVPKEKMPRDEYGNIADFVVDPMSTGARMNPGRKYEWYFSTSAREFGNKIKNFICDKYQDTVENIIKKKLLHNDVDSKDILFLKEKLMCYYKYMSPKVYNIFISNEYAGTIAHHLEYILTKGIYLHQDTNIQYTLPDLTRFVKSDSWYAPPFSKITYIDDDGNTQELIDDGLISTAYMMLLEKIGNDGSAVSTSLVNHLGLPTQNNHSTSIRKNATRNGGEAEIRSMCGNLHQKAVAEFMDRNTSLETAEIMSREILLADKPSAIENIVDRKIHPYGSGRALRLVRHLMYCSGYSIKWKPHRT